MRFVLNNYWDAPLPACRGLTIFIRLMPLTICQWANSIAVDSSLHFARMFLLPLELFPRILLHQSRASDHRVQANLLGPRVFPVAHTVRAPPLCAPFALGGTITPLSIVHPIDSGTAPTLQSANASIDNCSFEAPTNLYALTGSVVEVAIPALTTSVTYVRVASPPHMEPSTALECRRRLPVCPYNSIAWHDLLLEHGLFDQYKKIPDGFRNGFSLHLPLLTTSQTPPNHSSLLQYHDAFGRILERELTTGRYIGPFTHLCLETLIGPFQTSPVSIIPKSGRPNKHRVIQNFSFPLHVSPRSPQPSINSLVDSDDFPCTWGTFETVCAIIRNLPPGSQAATRDVAEAYRTIPLLLSQWPATVVRTDEDSFYVNTCTSFGMGPSAGAYGHIADAGADLFRAVGIGPLTKWVDDHLFFRVLRCHLEAYNSYRRSLHTILCRLPRRQTGGRLWFEGSTFADGSIETFCENCKFPIRDLSFQSVRSPEDMLYNCNFADINLLSDLLGIPWELSKDIHFRFQVLFIGLLWDLPRLTVGLGDAKKAKYLAAIVEWSSVQTHVLLDIQQLYGKLLHACLVIPTGRVYLTSLEAMLSTSSARPFVPHHSNRHLNVDLAWWTRQLSRPILERTIPQPCTFIDAHAFSDASSSFGIAVIIDGFWRAWTLSPNWCTLNGARDIGWAEAVGFELLVRYILLLRGTSEPQHFRVHCDNTGIVEGWRNGRSRNWATNSVFRRMLSLLDDLDHPSSFHLDYVPSGANPADKPSRGIFPPSSHLLPAIELPDALSDLLHNVPSQLPR